MPAIKSVRKIADGFEIVTTAQGIKTLTRDMIPANVLSQPVATVEAWVNAWLASNLTGMIALVHIEQLSPTLIVDVICSNTQPSANWWQPLPVHVPV